MRPVLVALDVHGLGAVRGGAVRGCGVRTRAVMGTRAVVRARAVVRTGAVGRTVAVARPALSWAAGAIRQARAEAEGEPEPEDDPAGRPHVSSLAWISRLGGFYAGNRRGRRNARRVKKTLEIVPGGRTVSGRCPD